MHITSLQVSVSSGHNQSEAWFPQENPQLSVHWTRKWDQTLFFREKVFIILQP